MPATPSTLSIAGVLLAEFEAQTPITRQFLERLPATSLTWKPHERSLTAGQLAFHIAAVPGSVVQFVQSNPATFTGVFNFPQPASRQEILDKLEETIATVRELLPTFDDDAMTEPWHMEANGQVVLTTTRAAFLRDIMFSHCYQHRGQFSVYLRLLDIPVPATWGPSADEPPPPSN